MGNIQYYTEEGLKKLKDELHELKTKGRADIAKQIAEARDKGDLSENAEYDAAKDRQGFIEARINEYFAALNAQDYARAQNVCCTPAWRSRYPLAQWERNFACSSPSGHKAPCRAPNRSALSGTCRYSFARARVDRESPRLRVTAVPAPATAPRHPQVHLL